MVTIPTEPLGTIQGSMVVVECGKCGRKAWATMGRTQTRTVCCGVLVGAKTTKPTKSAASTPSVAVPPPTSRLKPRKVSDAKRKTQHR